jgi:uncharacterized membrane protein
VSYQLLLVAHLLGAVLLGAAIVALWLVDGGIRRASNCGALARAGRRADALVKRVLAPGVLLLAGSGIWLVARYYGGWGFVRIPWLAAMAGLFVLQSVWANSVTRTHAQRMRRLLAGTRDADPLTPALQRARNEPLASFGQQLEPLLFALIVALGLLRPMDWGVVAVGCIAAALLAAAITFYAVRPPTPSSLSRASVEAEGGT